MFNIFFGDALFFAVSFSSHKNSRPKFWRILAPRVAEFEIKIYKFIYTRRSSSTPPPPPSSSRSSDRLSRHYRATCAYISPRPRLSPLRIVASQDEASYRTGRSSRQAVSGRSSELPVRVIRVIAVRGRERGATARIIHARTGQVLFRPTEGGSWDRECPPLYRRSAFSPTSLLFSL